MGAVTAAAASRKASESLAGPVTAAEPTPGREDPVDVLGSEEGLQRLAEDLRAPLELDDDPGYEMYSADALNAAARPVGVHRLARNETAPSPGYAVYVESVRDVALKAIEQRSEPEVLNAALEALKLLAAKDAPAPVVHVAPAEITVHTPDVYAGDVHVTVPERKVETNVTTPEVRVEPTFQVEPAPVTIQPGPPVNVTVEPAAVNVTVEPEIEAVLRTPDRKVEVTRDAYGQIQSATVTEEDQ